MINVERMGIAMRGIRKDKALKEISYRWHLPRERREGTMVHEEGMYAGRREGEKEKEARK